jgi:prepilin-type N-terminal cleavage/methylation domain-containing protein
MKKPKGFTLLELLVVLAICGILSVIAVPHGLKWLDNTRLRTAAMDLFADLQHARITAARTNRNVILVFNTDQQGMLDGTYSIFVDNGRQKSTIWTHEPDEVVLRSGSIPPGVHLVKVSFAGGVPKTRFNPMGFPNGFGGHIYMRSQCGNYMGIHVNINGRPRIVRSDSGEAGTWH